MYRDFVQVASDPADPAGSATLVSVGALWAPGVLLAAIGTGLVAAGVAHV